MTPRILVVDDEPDLEALLRQKFRRQIRAGELIFLFAHDGEQALQMLAEQGDVEMVLSDINMPRMDGLTLLQKLQEREADLRAVIVSAYGDMKNIRTAMNRGAFDFLTKPIDLDDLQTTVDKTLEEIAKQRALEEARLQAEQSKQMLSRYFSPSVVRELERDPDSMHASGTRRFVSFMFTDLADFTSLVESTDPEVILPLLNEYLQGVTEIVFAHEGTVIQVVGDAVHAMFGAPVEQSDHADRAVRCALAIDQFCESFRTRQVDRDIALGVTRVGVNSGNAIVGNFGGAAYFDYTAHGDAINIAARLESVNKQLGTRICVSESTASVVSQFRGRPVGELVLKGKSEPLMAFEPLAEDVQVDERVSDYAEAFALMQCSDPSASQKFASYVGCYGEDSLATFHLRRLLAGETGARILLTEK